MLTRRTFLAGATAATASTAFTSKIRAAESPRKKIVFLGTEVREHSHAQHFFDRLTLGDGWRGV
jgi:hypothetical protein